MAPSSRATFLCSAQRIDLESGCYRFHPTGHQAAPFRPNGMPWTSLDRKSQCFHLSSSELLLQFCHCMLILGRVTEDSCCFLHRRWWILRPNAAPEWQAISYCNRSRLVGGLSTPGACSKVSLLHNRQRLRTFTDVDPGLAFRVHTRDTRIFLTLHRI